MQSDDTYRPTTSIGLSANHKYLPARVLRDRAEGWAHFFAAAASQRHPRDSVPLDPNPGVLARPHQTDAAEQLLAAKGGQVPREAPKAAPLEIDRKNPAIIRCLPISESDLGRYSCEQSAPFLSSDIAIGADARPSFDQVNRYQQRAHWLPVATKYAGVGVGITPLIVAPHSGRRHNDFVAGGVPIKTLPTLVSRPKGRATARATGNRDLHAHRWWATYHRLLTLTYLNFIVKV